MYEERGGERERERAAAVAAIYIMIHVRYNADIKRYCNTSCQY